MKKNFLLLATTLLSLTIASCAPVPTSQLGTSDEPTSSTTTGDATTTTDQTTTTGDTTDSSSDETTTNPTTTSEDTTSSAPLGDIDNWYNGVTFTTTPAYRGLKEKSINEAKTYYAGINFSENILTIKSKLKTLVGNHTVVKYGAGDLITERDWTLSPDRDDKDPYMNLIYAKYNGSTTTAAKKSQIGTIWDREHIWAKSHMGSPSKSDARHNDLHHLRASDRPTNNNPHNSRSYGNVVNGKIGKDYRGNINCSYSGDNSGGLFEPADEYKGDIARAMFYMNLIYPQCAKITSAGTTDANSCGVLKDLLEWNKLDPVDEFELNRCNLINDEFQHNRNPYVDNPLLADLIYA